MNMIYNEYPLPDLEKARLARLHSLGVLDTIPNEAIEGLTRLAASLFDMPTALVSLVEVDRQWFMAKFGLEASETSRDVSFCTHAICGTGPFIVEDATKDPRFSSNPLVTGKLGIRFYAGHPITVDGHNIGTFCVVSNEPRTIDNREIELLEILAAAAADQILLVETKNRAAIAEVRLFDTIHALQQPHAVFDHRGKLVAHNRPFRDLHPDLAVLLRPGLRYHDILRSAALRNAIDGPDVQNWIDEEGADFESDVRILEFEIIGSGAFCLVDHQLSGGGWLSRVVRSPMIMPATGVAA